MLSRILNSQCCCDCCIQGYNLKLSSQFVSSKSSNALFLVNMTSAFSRMQVLMYSKNLMDDLCIAVTVLSTNAWVIEVTHNNQVLLAQYLLEEPEFLSASSSWFEGQEHTHKRRSFLGMNYLIHVLRHLIDILWSP